MRSGTQADGLVNMLDRKPAKVLAVCSGKGGVGKTSISVNLAVALSAMGRDVCLLDADVSLANVDVLLGLQPRFNLSHVVAGEADLESTIVQGPKKLRIVPASSGAFDMTDLPPASQAGIIQAFGELARQPEILVVDTAAGINAAVARFVQAAQHPVVVLRDEPASLTDAYALIKVFSRHYGIDRFNVITNQSAAHAGGRALYRKLVRVTDRYLDVVVRHLGDIPDDRHVVRSIQQQRSVVDAYPLSPSAREFLKIGKRIDALPASREPGGGIEFFFERLLRAGNRSRGKVA